MGPSNLMVGIIAFLWIVLIVPRGPRIDMAVLDPGARKFIKINKSTWFPAFAYACVWPIITYFKNIFYEKIKFS
jgi:hypothetical protein